MFLPAVKKKKLFKKQIAIITHDLKRKKEHNQWNCILCSNISPFVLFLTYFNYKKLITYLFIPHIKLYSNNNKTDLLKYFLCLIDRWIAV